MLPCLDISWVGRPNHQKTGGSRPNSEGFDIQSVGQDFRLFSRFIVVPCDQNLGSRPGDRLTLCDIMVYKGGSGKRTKPKGNGDTLAIIRFFQAAKSQESERSRKAMETRRLTSDILANAASGKRTKPKGNGDGRNSNRGQTESVGGQESERSRKAMETLFTHPIRPVLTWMGQESERSRKAMETFCRHMNTHSRFVVRKANEAERQWRPNTLDLAFAASFESGKRTKPKGNGDC